jgi:NADH-quinone oxidoreductase subunit K
MMGVIIRRNAIIIFMSIELMLNGVNLTFIAFSRFLHNIDGHIFAFMVMTVAAAEAAVGLAIIISVFRNKPTVNVDEINLMKW